MKWKVTESYLASSRVPSFFEASTLEELERMVQTCAAQADPLRNWNLRFEGYTDEMHVFFRERNGRSRRFMSIQADD